MLFHHLQPTSPSSQSLPTASPHASLKHECPLKNAERLLQLRVTSDKSWLANLSEGLVRHQVYDAAREAVENCKKNDPKYMGMLELRKEVIRKGGKWVPTMTWT